MGLEPTTSSLGRRQSNGNKEHCVSWHLVLAIENTAFWLCASYTDQTEHKRSTRIDLSFSRSSVEPAKSKLVVSDLI